MRRGLLSVCKAKSCKPIVKHCCEGHATLRRRDDELLKEAESNGSVEAIPITADTPPANVPSLLQVSDLLAKLQVEPELIGKR